MNESRAGGRGGRSSGIAGEVWLREPRAYRSAPPLTRDRIVAETVALLDEEGAARLTMRHLAERLGAGSTTLYWHVRTKDDVLDLALDAIFRDVPLPAAPGHWADDVRGLITAWYAVMLRHPWAPGLLGRPMLGPNVLARTEFLQATLARGGLTGVDLAAATHGLANYVIGSALTRTAGGPEDVADQHVRAHADEYPTLAATGHLGEQDWNELFRRGLDALIAGLTGSGA
ncbi:TetR/AcrR family transcriptional regulator [Actinophytocola gossypii]|uniref:TetR/AcrR family transcriptional regulator n=1 Tax=Actinophytocola gossypii TaxID=2812003 RepID=UPI0021A3255C|nr:TetR/AcrR family transcriptional regulator [Actinophytocola gossypii]